MVKRPNRVDVVRRKLVQKFSGPTATVYACPFCKHTIRVPKGRPGVGRGYGLATGGAAHAQIGSHIREEHPVEVAAEIAKYEAEQRRWAELRAVPLIEALKLAKELATKEHGKLPWYWSDPRADRLGHTVIPPSMQERRDRDLHRAREIIVDRKKGLSPG